MRVVILISCFIAVWLPAQAQKTFPVNGVHDERDVYHAFTNATIYITSQRKVDSATLLILNDEIVNVGQGVSIPKGTVVHDCQGMVIYPSFIDIYAGIGYKNPSKKKDSKSSPSNTPGNWNPAIRPEHKHQEPIPLDKKSSEDWLASGIGVVNLHQRDGIMRGSSVLLRLGVEEANHALIKPQATHHFSFDKGSSPSDYPSSHIGAVALIRQTLYDAEWYNQSSEQKEEVNPSLEALKSVSQSTNIFELNSPLSWRNVEGISKEFGVPFIIKGTGKEYLLSNEINKGDRVIVSVALPDAYDIDDPYEALQVNLEQMKHWEAAPYCAYFLYQRGADVALSRDTISKKRDFLKNLRKMGNSGITHDEALRMLTSTPAKFLDISQRYGTLETGKSAGFFIANSTFVEKQFEILEHWVNGEKVYEADPTYDDIAGIYNLVINGIDFELKIKASDKKGIQSEALRKADETSVSSTVTIEDELVSVILRTKPDKEEDESQILYRLSGKISLKGSLWDGRGQDSTGSWVTWGAIKDRKSENASTKTAKSDGPSDHIPSLWHPNMAYGRDSIDSTQTFIITNAVVWTSADTGKLNLADIWVENGKIKALGSNMMYPSDLRRIDAKGKHVTPGIIDEHSHIAIRGGVNEWAQASSAEVRISDAIDPWNIHLYRQLGGGVTTAQLLHGSANPIGGQSALIKLKWGKSAEDLLIPNAPGFIKFALGENVKRSNRRDDKGRFPLTRMGVEQTYVDAFTRAREYDSARVVKPQPKRRFSLKPTQPSLSTKRTDLELEALTEILNHERFITCHSYVQSEILMLMSVADSFDFKVNTFTHILEGYKVAEQMVEHGASGSTFSDWWAYKFEVNDAIPYNAALMSKVGVNVAINSDDAEMGRRLNQEAAKTMKYGGMSEEEALKMVTINPAKALRLDEQIGSIEVGKDADLVIWSGHPLSVYSEAEKTFIEGIKYFDRHEHDNLMERNEKERARLINKMILSDSKSKKPPQPKKENHYHCDTILEDYCIE